VQVLQREDERLTGGDIAERVHRRVVQRAAVFARVRVDVLRRAPPGQGSQPFVVPGIRRRAQQRLEQLAEGLVGRPELRRTAAQQDGRTVPVQRRRHLGEQAGLAGARLAPQEDDLPASGGDRGPDLLEGGQLRPSADESRARGRRPAHRQRWRRPAGHDRDASPADGRRR
jgi:hypothetical protein